MNFKSILTSYLITFACLAYAPVTLSQADSKTSNLTSQIEKELKQIDAAYIRNYLVMQGGDRKAGAAFFERLINVANIAKQETSLLLNPSELRTTTIQ